jgi:hypothetical protein
MYLSRRTAIKAASLAVAAAALPKYLRSLAGDSVTVISEGNPIIPYKGVCDPQVRVYDDQVYLYSTHDTSQNNKFFHMNGWQVWHSTDLVRWELVSTLKPEQTYFKKASSQCWATDAARRNGKYYFYFSMGPDDIGVVEGPTPAGPWHDPLGKALIAKGQVKTASRDPGILQEPDGTSYIVFGTFNYYIARLNEDMVSLAEEPRLITIQDPEGPYGKGKTDDKPFLHKRAGKYYLSWGCYYGISDSPYGPFACRGSIIKPDHLSAEFRDETNRTGPFAPPPQFAPKDWFGLDRHGSFFELFGQWYFICNDQALPGSTAFFRNSVISYVRYKNNGGIDPVRITKIGVGQYDAAAGIEATDFFKAQNAEVREVQDGEFQVTNLHKGSTLLYPRVRNLKQRPTLTINGSAAHSKGVEIEIRRGTATGALLSKINMKPQSGAEATGSGVLKNVGDLEDLCLRIQGISGDTFGLSHLKFS